MKDEYLSRFFFVKRHNNDEDEQLESELKAVHVEMYKSKLRQRERRKRVVRNHSLISKLPIPIQK